MELFADPLRLTQKERLEVVKNLIRGPAREFLLSIPALRDVTCFLEFKFIFVAQYELTIRQFAKLVNQPFQGHSGVIPTYIRYTSLPERRWSTGSLDLGQEL